jgi:hypothetical protein
MQITIDLDGRELPQALKKGGSECSTAWPNLHHGLARLGVDDPNNVRNHSRINEEVLAEPPLGVAHLRVVGLDINVGIGANLAGPLIDGLGEFAIPKGHAGEETQAVLGDGLSLPLKNLDDVKSENRAHRIADLTLTQLQCGPLKLWYQVAGIGPLEFSTSRGRARILGKRPSERTE